jgi:large subunit ribosomal protein L19
MKIENFIKPNLKTNLPDVQAGDTVRIYQKIKEVVKKGKAKAEKKEKIQIFEGLIIAKKHGKEIGATITVRKIISGIGVEKTFPIHSPIVEKIEFIKRGKIRRAKLYYLRTAKSKKTKLKTKKRKLIEVETEVEIENDKEKTN